jgi:hypothetical protein
MAASRRRFREVLSPGYRPNRASRTPAAQGQELTYSVEKTLFLCALIFFSVAEKRLKIPVKHVLRRNEKD